MPTKKTTQNTYTVNEAAKKLGVTRAAIHEALKNHKLEWTW
jgi:excisionase family DNA binding protein